MSMIPIQALGIRHCGFPLKQKKGQFTDLDSAINHCTSIYIFAPCLHFRNKVLNRFTRRCGAAHNWHAHMANMLTRATLRFQSNCRAVVRRWARLWSSQYNRRDEVRILQPALAAVSKQPIALLQPLQTANALAFAYRDCGWKN
ncbi:hypothetical protein [Caballeronia sp. SBC2]|uniref:hypothetical protein n=1 Tax=Caballeronia sp. SBC2 TaxID=2705547 RepID=UPI0013ED7FE9|nr:hypothetical protein [Caballeronia sp. SBC2]